MLFNNNLSFGFGYTAGSIAVANIIYSSPFTYTLDVNGNNLLTNQGSGADGLLYTGQGLEVGATQVFPIPIGTSGHCVAMYDTINTQWVYVTATTAPSYTIPAGTYGHIAVLAVDPSVADKAYLENNIDAIKDLWFGRATGLTSIVKANIQHLYIPDALQGAFIQDLVIIPSPSNQYLYSEEFDNAIWFKNAETITANTTETLDPMGTNTADILIPTAVANYHYIAQNIANYTIGDIYTISIYAKAKELSTIAIYFATANFSYATSTLNLSTGVATGAGKAENVGNGWYRFSLSPTAVANGTNTTVRITEDLTYTTRDGTSGVYVWGAQMEKGIYALEYTKTTTTKVVGTPVEYIKPPNYALTMYTNADLNPKGQQTASTLFDSTGRATGVDYDNLNFYSLGYLDTQTNLSLLGNFWIDEIIGTTIYQHHYNGTALTTYTNNVAGTAVAHTPENAMYKLGKGVYPKVTADPYATYKHKHFQVESGTYNQSTRYTELTLI